MQLRIHRLDRAGVHRSGRLGHCGRLRLARRSGWLLVNQLTILHLRAGAALSSAWALARRDCVLRNSASSAAFGGCRRRGLHRVVEDSRQLDAAGDPAIADDHGIGAQLVTHHFHGDAHIGGEETFDLHGLHPRLILTHRRDDGDLLVVRYFLVGQNMDVRHRHAQIATASP